MERILSIVSCLFVLYATQGSAHFLLNYPPTIGFDDDLEATAPCGSFTVDFSTDNVTDFHVGGDSLAMTSIHPQATWLFRATLDLTAAGGWESLLPAVEQTGLGDFCEKTVVIDTSWAGSKGVIGVVQDAPDGILYQCAAVNFVSGAAASIPSVCTNVTGLTAQFVSDPLLSSLQVSATGSATSSSATSSSATSTGTAATTTSTTAATSSTSSPSSSPTSKSSGAATITPSYGGLGQFIWVVVIGSATFLACLL